MDIDAEQVIGPFKIIGGTLGKGEMWLHKAAFTKSGEDEFIFPYQVYRNSNLVSYKEVSRRVDRRYANTMKETLFSFAWLTLPLGWLFYGLSQRFNTYEVIRYHLKFVDTNEATVEIDVLKD